MLKLKLLFISSQEQKQGKSWPIVVRRRCHWGLDTKTLATFFSFSVDVRGSGSFKFQQWPWIISVASLTSAKAIFCNFVTCLTQEACSWWATSQKTSSKPHEQQLCKGRTDVRKTASKKIIKVLRIDARLLRVYNVKIEDY